MRPVVLDQLYGALRVGGVMDGIRKHNRGGTHTQTRQLNYLPIKLNRSYLNRHTLDFILFFYAVTPVTMF